MSDEWVIEFPEGTFFVSPKAERNGSLDEAMRFSSQEEATEYADYNVPLVWMKGGMITTVASRTERWS